jgi:BMFP domain-containing protein YqiC
MAHTLDDYLLAKAHLEHAKAYLEKVTAEISSDMLERSVKSELAATAGGAQYTVTVVQRETLKVDEVMLLQTLGKRQFAKISDLKLNAKKLEAAVKDGVISAELVSSNSVISRSSPYLRVTDYSGED